MVFNEKFILKLYSRKIIFLKFIFKTIKVKASVILNIY
jgi:hypothetical protein